MTMLEEDNQANVYSAFLNKKNISQYNFFDGTVKLTKNEIQKELEETRNTITELTKDYKGLNKKESMTHIQID